MKHFTVILIGVICLIWQGGASRAYAADRVSVPEKAIMAFYKLSDITPDFANWGASMPRIAKAPDSDTARDYKEQERLRLQHGFGTYRPHEEPLEIIAEIAVKRTRDEKGAMHLQFRFVNSDDDEMPYFSFPFTPEYMIAVVVQDMLAFKDFALTPEEEARITRYLTKEDEEYMVELELRFRPIKTDTTKPYRLGGQMHWVMLADIAYLEFFVVNPEEGKKHKLWRYISEWYLTRAEKSLYQYFD